MSAGRAVNDANSSLDTIVHMDLLLEDSFVGQITIADATAIHALRTVCGQHSDCSSLLTLHGTMHVPTVARRAWEHTKTG